MLSIRLGDHQARVTPSSISGFCITGSGLPETRRHHLENHVQLFLANHAAAQQELQDLNGAVGMSVQLKTSR
jgi:hypothetical protein